MGEIESHIAIRRAREKGLDLILLNKNATPPVCKIGNYGKLTYEAEKKQKENKRREQETKILRVRPNTHKHDLDIEIAQAKKFILRGDKVRFECRFKAREIAFPHLGKNNLEYMVEQLTDISKIDSSCELVSRTMSITISPK